MLEHIPKCVWVDQIVINPDDRRAVNKIVRKLPLIHVMNEVYRILKDRGIFVVEVPFSDEAFNRDPTHVSRFSEDWYHYYQQEDNLYADQGLVECNFKLDKQSFRKYKWSDKDVIHTELIAVKSENKPFI